MTIRVITIRIQDWDLFHMTENFVVLPKSKDAYKSFNEIVQWIVINLFHGTLGPSGT